MDEDAELGVFEPGGDFVLSKGFGGGLVEFCGLDCQG
jgi:hypothetical protein